MTAINIEKQWEFKDIQTFETKDKRYFVHEAIRLSEDIEVKELKISEMYIGYAAPHNDTLRGFVSHMKMVVDADLNCPVLMNQDGQIIDGRHRLAKALLEGCETIKVQRFEKDPYDCFDWL